MSFAIQTHNLRRTFKGVTAVDRLDLAVPEGSVFGFLGPNGAGKTTSIRMLLGLIAPDAGDIHLNGHDLSRSRSEALSGVGAIVESPALYPNLTGREILTLAARLSGRPVKQGLDALEHVSLVGAMDRKVSGYSLGMRQRLALARAMMGSPRLLILDEPTNGLDPAGIADMRALICSLPKTLGATVFLSSHLLSEIELMATHCALLDQGRLVFQDRLEKLSDAAPARLVIETDAPDALAQHFARQDIPAEREQDLVRIPLSLSAQERQDLVRALVQEGIGVSGLHQEKPTLESLFLGLTGDGRGANT
ncbi:ABC transporter ATP-binding protein [Oceanicaulis sp. MMSF_3324]|uniref:ABC transporter ATP-binding protein n=1 Tax=Oceanicaulis sp. MMSF_3324 TaxID=3046702 RepID=UPI0027402EF8|nr:ABC transporter ATP-binding protein [Oceanicaulis sp. MMSF_3324]